MRFWRVVGMRFRSLFERRKLDTADRREMAMHLDLLVKEKIAEGAVPEEARRAAMREVGNIGLLAEQSRDERRVGYLYDFFDDLGFALRLLRKSPVFAVVSVVSLGLGIGANTAIFTLIKKTYLDMLPVRDPAQIVRLTRSSLSSPEFSSFSYPLFQEMSAANTPFEGFICQSGGRVSVSSENGGADTASIQFVSGNFHELLGVQPLLGRLLSPEDDRGEGAHPVLVLSYNYWRRRFASDPGIVGKSVRLNMTPMTVVGVSPPGFDGMGQGWSPDGMIPISMAATVQGSRSDLGNRGNHWLNVYGRLKPGTNMTQAEQALIPLMQAENEERAARPGTTEYVRSVLRSNQIHVRPFANGWHRQPGSARSSMALLGMTGLVLLAACLNLANLLLARTAARRGELAVRLAMGAGRFRLIRQLLTESLLLAVLGGVAGLALAWGAGPLVVRLAMGEDPQVTQTGDPDTAVLLLCLGISSLCGFVFGLAPAWQAARSEISLTASSSRTVAGTRLLGRKLLLSAQIALTLLLLAGGALFVKSMRNMQTADLGFVPEQLLQLTVLPKNSGYTDAQTLSFLDRTIEQIRRVPGVRAASVAAMPVMSNSSWGSGIRIEGVTVPESDGGPNRNAVGPDYFSTMQLPLLLGRDFNVRDGEGAPKVAVVNESFVRQYFGGENPIGRKIDQGGNATTPPQYTIVGVARDGKYRGVRDKKTAMWYVPLAQSGMRNFITVYVRTSGAAEKAAADVRRAVSSVDASVATMGLRSVESQIATQQRFERMIALLAAFMGLLAVILAVIGIYGVLSYLVNQRQREIGIRLALGASRFDVIRLVTGGVAGWTLLGIVLALPAVYYGAHAVKDLLYDMDPLDPRAMLWAAGTLAAGTVLAAWFPARRAAIVEPSEALRVE